MATVKVIEPQAIQPERLRVAAYCRVSSDSKDQLHSYAAQIRSYTEEIAQHDGWELVDVYEDLFDSLVEKVIAESQTRIRFRLCGGLELAEQLEVAAR